MIIFLFENIFVLHVYARFFFRFIWYFLTIVYICFIRNQKLKKNEIHKRRFNRFEPHSNLNTEF